MMKVNLENLDTAASYAEKTGYSVGHVHKLMNDGVLKTFKIGKTRLIINEEKDK